MTIDIDAVIKGVVITLIASPIVAFINHIWKNNYLKIRSYLPIFLNIRRRYVNKQLSSVSFIKWRDEVLTNIYGEDCFTEEFGIKYPSCIIPVKQVEYPFNDFLGDINYSEVTYDKNGDICPRCLKKEPVFQDQVRKRLLRKKIITFKYRLLVGASIKHPKLIGFCLDNYQFDRENDYDEVAKMNTKLGYYENNVYTSHILEYELYLAYRRLKGKIRDKSILWQYLPFRQFIHFDGDTNEISAKEVLLSGCRRSSLISVQAIILFKSKDNNDSYETLMVKRSEDPKKVASKLGFYQFLPAGGFEIYDSDGPKSKEMIRENYRIDMSVFREYLEEVFNLEEVKESKVKDNREPLNTIRNHDEYKRIINYMDDKKATIDCVGICVDLVSLRHELSFVIRVDDDKYPVSKFEANYEYHKSTREKAARYFKDVESFIKQESLSYKVHHSSAALYHITKAKLCNELSY